MEKRALLIDDDPDSLALLDLSTKQPLVKKGLVMVKSTTLDEACSLIINDKRIALVITDLIMPKCINTDCDSFLALHKIKQYF